MKLLNILQIIVSVLLIVVILMQNRGAGLSGLFGGTGNVYQAKRGLEKNLFTATIIISIAFFVISFIIIII